MKVPILISATISLSTEVEVSKEEDIYCEAKKVFNKENLHNWNIDEFCYIKE